MDRRNEQQFIDRMYQLAVGLSKSCIGCLRKGSQCRVCWSNEAKNLVTDMNTYPEPDLMTEKKDLCKETAQVIEFINAHLGVTVKMMLATFANMNENTMQHLMRKLLKAKKISSSNGCPRVFFPASTPQDAIESISSTFKKARKEKNGKG